ncbi:hypothetical protein ANO11243_004030 [Dothideomycetidae sp. 11243]|nr:hypothetical protein ANO11243_004030 [fungal sp. No.11243]
MPMHILTSAALAAAGLTARAAAQACVQSGGNWYCNQVNTVAYTNFGSSGSYNGITAMDETTGQCSFAPVAYSGSMAPFDEELSIHIRGPFSLKQFAFYTPSSASTVSNVKKTKGRKKKGKGKSRRNLQDTNLLERNLHERDLLSTVHCPNANETYFTVDGKRFQIECAMNRQGQMALSYQPNFGSCIQQCAQTTGCVQATSSALGPRDYIPGVAGARLVSTDTTKSQDSDGSAYTRQSYYNSASQSATGVTFLNNLGGGTFPGIWSTTFGNSLGYASSSGLLPAMSSTVLADTTLPSTSEISLWTSSECTSANPCPYSRPKSVAYHGFGGASKIFLFEFQMPHDASGADMPALWFLNARIPRTQQYGACSCWGNTNGCGELDAFEVLTGGEERMISAVHGEQAATDPNYFPRPTTSTMKAAVSFNGAQAVLRVLDDSFDFSEGLTQSQVDALFAAGSGGQAASMALPN